MSENQQKYGRKAVGGTGIFIYFLENGVDDKGKLNFFLVGYSKDRHN